MKLASLKGIVAEESSGFSNHMSDGFGVKKEEKEEMEEDMPGNTDVDKMMLAAEADIANWRRERERGAETEPAAPESFWPSETDEMVQRFVEKEEE